VHRYGQYLTSLDLRIPHGTLFSRQYVIPLPELETLTFGDSGKDKSPIMMITPKLKIFVTRTDYHAVSFPLEMDLGLLTHVSARGDQIPPLLELSGLKFLHLYPNSPCYSEFLKPLVDDPSVCRELELVELRLMEENMSDADYSDFHNLFLRINGRRTGYIEHFIHSQFASWHKKLPKVGYYTVSDPLALPLI
jgi:hypothetical protein